MKTTELFNLKETLAAELLENAEYPEGVLGELRTFIERTGVSLDTKRYFEISDGVWVARTANIAPTAFILTPCIIGERTEVRHCAYIRGAVLIGDDCVVGNSCEIKNSILFNKVQVPHFNYVGDSVLGFASHLGAGAVTSNVKSDKSSVCVIRDGERISTGRRKLGAMVGDRVEIGCGAVLCPGTVVGRDSVVYPLSLVRGTVPAESIYKNNGESVSRVMDK